jgi:hypothetical protein
VWAFPHRPVLTYSILWRSGAGNEPKPTVITRLKGMRTAHGKQKSTG